MGACAILPRIIGHGRAAELLFTGRSMSAEEGVAWGFFSRIADDVHAEAQALARELADRPDARPLRDQAPARRRMGRCRSTTRSTWRPRPRRDCMETKDFHRAYEAFAAKRKPEFKGD